MTMLVVTESESERGKARKNEMKTMTEREWERGEEREKENGGE